MEEIEEMERNDINLSTRETLQVLTEGADLLRNGDPRTQNPIWQARMGKLIVFTLLDWHNWVWDNNKPLLEELVNSPEITFQDPNNSYLIIPSLQRWISSTWTDYLRKRPDVMIRIYEKCVHVIPADIIKEIIDHILTSIGDERIHYISNYAARVIESSFPRVVFLLDSACIMKAFHVCKRKVMSARADSHLYIKVWEKLHLAMPKIVLDKFNIPSDLIPWKYDYQMNKLLFGLNEGEQARRCLDCSDRHIMVFLVVDNDSLKNKEENFKINCLSLINSLNLENLEILFKNKNFNEKFFEMVAVILDEDSQAVANITENYLLKLCRFSVGRDHEPMSLKECLICIARFLFESTKRENIDFALNMNLAAERELFSNLKKVQTLVEREFEYDDDGRNFYLYKLLALNMFSKTEIDDQIPLIFSYGLTAATIPSNQNLTIKQVYQLAWWYRLNKACKDLLLSPTRRLVELRLSEKDWSFENFAKLLNLVVAFERILIADHIEELLIPAARRNGFFKITSPRFFEVCQSYALDSLLEIAEIAIEHFPRTAFEFQNFGDDESRRLEILFKKHDRYKRQFEWNFVDAIDDLKNQRNDVLMNYISPLVDMFCVAMEVTVYQNSFDKLFELSYVPVVKSLILLAPREILRLIVAFCRSDLRLSLTDSYVDLQRCQQHWTRIHNEQTIEKSREFFGRFEKTVSDIHRWTADDYSPDGHAPLLMEQYVAAVVNHHQLFDAKETKDWLVCRHYYDIVRNHDWRRLWNEESRNILFADEEQ